MITDKTINKIIDDLKYAYDGDFSPIQVYRTKRHTLIYIGDIENNGGDPTFIINYVLNGENDLEYKFDICGIEEDNLFIIIDNRRRCNNVKHEIFV